MELTEAAKRIFSHWRLILTMTLIALLIPVGMHLMRQDTYVASARLSIGHDTTNASQAEALVDTAKGIITSPGQVIAALDKVSVFRDPKRLANDHIDVESVGTSGVLVLTVSDEDPEVATALANVLAEQLLAARRAQAIDPLVTRLEQLDADFEAVGKDIAAIEATAQASVASIDLLRLQLDEALRRRSEIRAQREGLNQALAAAPKPLLIDAASVPGNPQAVSLEADLVVAGLLGLIVGIAMAAIVEAFRPSIVGSDALARVLGAPVLGRIPYPALLDADGGDRWLTQHLGLAASSAGVDEVQLAAIGPDIDLEHLASQLRLSAAQVRFSSTAAAAMPLLAVEVVGSTSEDNVLSRKPKNSKSRDSGVVVVAPDVVARNSLGELEHILAITRWPLLGIISYSNRRARRRTPTGGADEAVEVQVELVQAPERTLAAEPWA